jgi:hypothetical protein
MLTELVPIGKIISIVAQASFGIFALTHDWKKDGKLTRAGRAAVMGIAVSALFGVFMFWAEDKVKRDLQEIQLEEIARQQAVQTELLAKQAETLRTTQRSLFPIRKVRVSVALAFPPTSEAYLAECGEWSTVPALFSDKPSILSARSAESDAGRPVKYLTHASGSLIITPQGEPHPKLHILLRGASLREGDANRIVDRLCVRDKGIIVRFVYNETRVLENSGIWSILDLQGKQVTVSLVARSPEVLNYGHILSFEINFSEDKTDASTLLTAGPTDSAWTIDQVLAVSSGLSENQALQRSRKEGLMQWGPVKAKTVTWSASVRADRNTMKMLGLFGGN